MVHLRSEPDYVKERSGGSAGQVPDAEGGRRARADVVSRRAQPAKKRVPNLVSPARRHWEGQGSDPDDYFSALSKHWIKIRITLGIP